MTKLNEKHMPTQEEVDAEMEQADTGIHSGSIYPAMSYEDGVKATLEWIIDREMPKPFE